MQMGFSQSTKAGVSICIDDMRIPRRKGEILERAYSEVSETEVSETELHSIERSWAVNPKPGLIEELKTAVTVFSQCQTFRFVS